MKRNKLSALAALFLTTAHHIYEAHVYNMPSRGHHILAVSIVAAALLVGAFRVLGSPTASSAAADAIAFWIFAGVTLLVVVGIGLFESGYGHLAKNAFYLSGASTVVTRRYFPPPTWAVPSNVFFEITGVLQIVPAFATGYYFYCLTQHRRAGIRFEGALARPSEPANCRRLSPGRRLGQYSLRDVKGARVPLPDPHHVIHLQLRRFAGCPICNLHLRSFVRRYDEILSAGVREVVVFHSSRDELLPHAQGLPFHVVADPRKELYAELGAESALRALLDRRVWRSIARAVLMTTVELVRGRAKLPSANPTGGRFGLPADFLIARDGTVLACKYGEHAADQWSVTEMLALAATDRPVEE